MLDTAQAPSGLPEDLRAICDELSKSEIEGRKFVTDLSDVEINWQAEAGKTWSIAQCFEHLTKTNDLHTNAMCAAVRSIRSGEKLRRGPLRPNWFERYFIRAMDAPPREKFRTSPKALPGEVQPVKEVFESFSRSHREMRSLLEESCSIDLNRVRFMSPFIWWLRMSVGAGFLLLTAHERRHLWQARQVRTLIEM